MQILVVWPPHVPSYFNAGHHLPVFNIAAYLRHQSHTVTALDAGALNQTWKEFGDTVYQGRYDAVVLVNEYDVVEGVRRAADYCRALLPDAMLITVGRLSYQNPDFFRSLELDAIVSSGDYEAGSAAAVAWHAAGRPPDARLPGTVVRTPDGWNPPAGPGIWLPVEEWVLPDVDEIPYAAYDRLYHSDRSKFCGIPKRRELVVPVARGCPIGCAFCDVHPMQGLRERRITVGQTIDYIRDAFARHPFEYVAFYAPTFTLDRRWVGELCDALSAQPRRYPWKCATTLHHLDADLVAWMAAAGCIRISVGLETLEDEAAVGLPRVKRQVQTQFDAVSGWCTALGVELNCFVIVGLPGTTPQGTRRTIETLARAGARARPTLYTPYGQMGPDMTERQLSAFNRHLIVDAEAVSGLGRAPTAFLEFIFGADSYTTPASDRVLEVASSHDRGGPAGDNSEGPG